MPQNHRTLVHATQILPEEVHSSFFYLQYVFVSVGRKDNDVDRPHGLIARGLYVDRAAADFSSTRLSAQVEDGQFSPSPQTEHLVSVSVDSFS